MLYIKNYYIIFVLFLDWLVIVHFVYAGLARAKSFPTKTYSNEVVTLWCVLLFILCLQLIYDCESVQLFLVLSVM